MPGGWTVQALIDERMTLVAYFRNNHNQVLRLRAGRCERCDLARAAYPPSGYILRTACSCLVEDASS